MYSPVRKVLHKQFGFKPLKHFIRTAFVAIKGMPNSIVETRVDSGGSLLLNTTRESDSYDCSFLTF